MITYQVPKGTNPSTCRGKTCRAEVFWVEYLGTPKKKGDPPRTVRNPIDCRTVAGDTRFYDKAQPPTASLDGVGVSHFSVCADVANFTHRRPAKPETVSE